MGAIAEAFLALAQPLIDQTDGSLEEVQKALTITQACYNLSLLPPADREDSIREFQLSLEMDDEEFFGLRRGVLDPMIERWEFAMLKTRNLGTPFDVLPRTAVEYQTNDVPPKLTTADRYAPCPCNSGKKYKFCCGRTAR